MHFKNGQLVFKKNFIVLPYNENTADYLAFLMGLNNNGYKPAVLTSKKSIKMFIKSNLWKKMMNYMPKLKNYYTK